MALFDEMFTDLFADDAVGHGELLLVGGEAGVGKSRFVDQLTGRARAADATVLRGWCVEHGADIVPLAPIADLLRDIVAQTTQLELDEIMGPAFGILARLLPELGRAEHRHAAESLLSMAALSDGVLRALRGLSDRQPVLVVLEDLHWSDTSTRQLLTFLAPRLARHRILLVATYRTDELHRRHPLRPFLVSLRRAVRPEQIELRPFTPDELADLVAGITGVAPTRWVVDTLHDRCAGNAFFAEELLAGEASGRPSSVLRDAVLSRTDDLDRDAMTVLATAAAAGHRVAFPVLTDASGLSSEDFRQAIEAIVAAGLCVPDADGICFRHELTREVIEAELLAGDRPRVHAALAATLQLLTPHRRGEIARHWAAAGHQPAALEASVAAGRAAVEVAADAEALTQFERALELWDLVPDAAVRAGCEHGALLLDAADAAGRARLFSKAIALGHKGVAEVAGLDPAAERLACLRLIPWAWFGFEDEEVRALIKRSSSAVTKDPADAGAALALAWQALLDVAACEYSPVGAEEARSTAQRAIELAQVSGSAQAEVHAEITLGVCTCIGGDPAGLGQIRIALEKAKNGGFAAEAGRAYDSLAVYLAAFGRHDDVIELEQDALDYCTAAGVYLVHGVMVQLRVIRSLHRTGRWQSVEQRVQRLRAEFGTLNIEHLTLADSWGLILVRRGQLDGVQELVDDTFARVGDHPSVIGPVTITAIELQAALGQAPLIPELVESTLDRILPRFPGDAAAVLAAAIGALADLAPSSTRPGSHHDSLATGQVDAWLARVRYAQPLVTPPWITIAEAECARLHDKPSERLWVAAVDAWRGSNAPYEYAYTQYRLAEAMLKKGSNRQTTAVRSSARTLLTDARQAAGRLGAETLANRIDTLAARAHVSLGPPEDPRTPTTSHKTTGSA